MTLDSKMVGLNIVNGFVDGLEVEDGLDESSTLDSKNIEVGFDVGLKDGWPQRCQWTRGWTRSRMNPILRDSNTSRFDLTLDSKMVGLNVVKGSTLASKMVGLNPQRRLGLHLSLLVAGDLTRYACIMSVAFVYLNQNDDDL